MVQLKQNLKTEATLEYTLVYNKDALNLDVIKNTIAPGTVLCIKESGDGFEIENQLICKTTDVVVDPYNESLWHIKTTFK